MRQWFGRPCGAPAKTWSWLSVSSGRESRRGSTGSWSQGGRGAARRVLEAERGEGCAWRRRWERCFQVGRGAVLIWGDGGGLEWNVLVGEEEKAEGGGRGYFVEELGFFAFGDEVGDVVGCWREGGDLGCLEGWGEGRGVHWGWERGGEMGWVIYCIFVCIYVESLSDRRRWTMC